MLRTAIAFAKRGLAVFPCRARDKRPATEHGVKDATTDAEIIRRWWQHDPQFNVAIATGEVSNVFVVDIDGVDAELELRRLEAAHGELPATVESITARGRHLFFQMPETPVRNTASQIAAGIDTRGNGGYVVCPPSIHPSGRAYAWSVDSANAFAAAPDWLLGRITERSANGNGHIAAAALRVARADGRGRPRRAPRLHASAHRRLSVAPPHRPGIRARACADFQHHALPAAAAGQGRRAHRQFDLPARN